MNSNPAKISNDSLEVKLDLVVQQLEELLALFDANSGYEIAALHVDQALNALKYPNQRINDQSEATEQGFE